MNVQYRATLISIDGRILTEGSRVDCQSRTSRRRRRNVVGASIAAVDKGKKREGVRFKLIVQFKEPGSKD